MEVTLNPFTLTFSDGHLESRYISHQENEHLYMEQLFILLDAVLLTTSVFAEHFSARAWATVFFLGAVLTIHFLLFIHTRREIIICYRFWMLLAIRAARVTMFKYILPWYYIPPDSEGFIEATAFRAGFILMFWHGIGLQTRFREYVFLQGIFTFIVVRTISYSVCLGLLEKPVHVQTVLRYWGNLRDIAVHFVGNESHLLFNDDPAAIEVCPMLISMAHVPISFILPCVVIYLLEIRSRHHFLISRQRNGMWMGIQLRILLERVFCFIAGDATKHFPSKLFLLQVLSHS